MVKKRLFKKSKLVENKVIEPTLLIPGLLSDMFPKFM